MLFPARAPLLCNAFPDVVHGCGLLLTYKSIGRQIFSRLRVILYNLQLAVVLNVLCAPEPHDLDGIGLSLQ